MKRDEDLTMLRECYRMGRGIDFCWGRVMVIEQCDDIPRDGLQRLCRFGGHNISEVLAGVEYQKSVFRAAAMLMKNANNGANEAHGANEPNAHYAGRRTA